MEKNIITTDFQDLDFNLDFGNYNPDEIQTDETINAVFVIDTSSSIYTYVNELNYAFNDFTDAMQKSHIADKLFVSIIEFNTFPEAVSGFMPVSQINNTDFSKKIGGMTALYDAVYMGVKNALAYRNTLENSGIECKTLIFIITDGEDNSSSKSPAAVKKLLNKIKSEERNMFSFSSMLFGVGSDASFEEAKNKMGIDYLAKIGTSGEEMKRMIGFISQSISSVSAGQIPPVF